MRVVDEPSDPVRTSLRPLKNEVARPIDPDKTLESENRWVKLVNEPSEPVKDLARPLASEPARDNEPVKVLESELW